MRVALCLARTEEDLIGRKLLGCSERLEPQPGRPLCVKTNDPGKTSKPVLRLSFPRSVALTSVRLASPDAVETGSSLIAF